MSDIEHHRAAYHAARAAGGSRHRDIAAGLQLSEGALIDAHVGAPPDGLHAVRLRGPFPDLLAELAACGDLMALTRNAHCVHERTGPYLNLSAQGPMGQEVGLALGDEIDLRIFYRHWHVAYAVTEGAMQSLQFFDAHGTALHKVFTRPATEMADWAALRARWSAPDAAPVQWRPAPAVANGPDIPVADGGAALRADWTALRDTHDFFTLLKRHGVRRRQALALAAPAYAQALDASAARVMLEGAAATGTPIMVFVSNPGLIQIHSGPVQRIAVMGPWLNVLDARFNLHLREDAIHEAWAVRKPTVDGLVSSLELLDRDGELIAQFFGQRKPGQPERCAWRQLVDGLVQEPAWRSDSIGCAA
jgi:putative hemin transport protein